MTDFDNKEMQEQPEAAAPAPSSEPASQQPPTAQQEPQPASQEEAAAPQPEKPRRAPLLMEATFPT